jgi:hypothetical protein
MLVAPAFHTPGITHEHSYQADRTIHHHLGIPAGMHALGEHSATALGMAGPDARAGSLVDDRDAARCVLRLHHLFVWVCFKERTLAVRVVWLIAILSLGNMAMAAYVLRQLLRVRPGEPVSAILLPANPSRLRG